MSVVEPAAARRSRRTPARLAVCLSAQRVGAGRRQLREASDRLGELLRRPVAPANWRLTGWVGPRLLSSYIDKVCSSRYIDNMNSISITETTDALNRQLGEVVATDPMAVLAALKAVHTVVAHREREAVTAALVDHTFREIGDVLGVSKQAVFQRFGKDWAVSSKAQMSKTDWKQQVKKNLVGP